MIRANPYIAIDRLAALRQQIADLQDQADLAQAAILRLPDGRHDGLATHVDIRTDQSGLRHINLLTSDATTRHHDRPETIGQPDATAETLGQMG